MKGKIKKDWEKAQNWFIRVTGKDKKHLVKAVAWVLLLLLMLGATIKLVLWIIGLISQVAAAIGMFLNLYLIPIILIGILALRGIEWLKKRWWEHQERKRQLKEEKKRQAQEEQRRQAYSYEMAKDATYKLEGKMLYSIARELGGVGLVPPMRLDNLYSPGRTIPMLGGAFMFCVYLIQKSGETVDTESIKAMMQTKIDQRLAAGEYPEITPSIPYNGKVYSGFVIEVVRDSLGYVEVITALVNEAYCRWKEHEELNGNTLPPTVDRRDMIY